MLTGFNTAVNIMAVIKFYNAGVLQGGGLSLIIGTLPVASFPTVLVNPPQLYSTWTASINGASILLDTNSAQNAVAEWSCIADTVEFELFTDAVSPNICVGVHQFWRG